MPFRSIGSESELFPHSVFIIASCGENDKPCAMNAAGAGEKVDGSRDMTWH